ncbi:RNA chaperone Hfq [Candidatus Magnetominusculus dajiuhuensis]|uniref:RNA chaperone Hfq n=1 Tax=Candidatus Magnetominusculus dajiuhuensis TaxID=3137712 RepID=UPI003B43C6F3
MAADRGTTLQDTYLNLLRKEKTPVVVYLINGVKLKGVIKGFDNFVIILRDVREQLIYKHSISSILPEGDTVHCDEEIAASSNMRDKDLTIKET